MEEQTTRKYSSKRRSIFECYRDVLSALSRNGTMSKMRLMYATNLSCKVFNKILTSLISLNMIRMEKVLGDRRSIYIVLLPLGAETYKGINKYLNMLGLESMIMEG